MNWQEIVTSASTYRAKQDEVYRQRARERAEEYRRRPEEAKRRKEREVAQAQEILKRLQAREVLQVIRDEVWHEGGIREVFEQQEIGLELFSFYYRKVHLRRQGRGLRIELKPERAQLAIMVVPKRDAFADSQDDRGKMVMVRERNVCSSFEENLSAMRRGEAILHREVREHGLKDGLRRIIEQTHITRAFDGISYIDPAEEDAEGNFHATLFTHVNQRVQNLTLPSEIREWFDGVVNQLPEILSSRGYVTHQELREWGHQVRGTPRAVVLFDRLLHRV